jgi:hypothetical protein
MQPTHVKRLLEIIEVDEGLLIQYIIDLVKLNRGDWERTVNSLEKMKNGQNQ